MPTCRRSHTKSRRGCIQCKQRHVKVSILTEYALDRVPLPHHTSSPTGSYTKVFVTDDLISQCDEATPSCGYCLKREVTCSFITGSRDNTDSVNASPYSQSDVSAFPLPHASTSRASELRLMHNWSTKAYKTLRQHSDESYLWQIVVPDLALSHEYLLDALLALSARHLSLDDPANAASWDCAALDYENKALTGFQLAIGSIVSSNCEAIFACSILIMVFSLAQSHWQEDNHFSDALVDILELRQFLVGIGVVQNDYHDYLRLSSFGVLFTPHTPRQIETDDSTGVPLSEMHRVVDTTLESMRAKIPDSTDTQSYSDAISSLQQAMHVYCTGGLFSGIMAWPVGLGEGIIQLIENKEPLAIAILSHYGIIIHLLRDRWWARNAGKRLVRTTIPILQEARPEFAALVQRAWTAVTNDQSSHNTPSNGI
ncbi:hypothetical protein D6C97_09530 [Aureobasidium pullulans]|nr:hypothetical protein D6C97_09530 [Aureobasidium pullulans]